MGTKRECLNGAVSKRSQIGNVSHSHRGQQGTRASRLAIYRQALGFKTTKDTQKIR